MIKVKPNIDPYTRCLSCNAMCETLYDIEIKYEGSNCGHTLTLCKDCMQKITDQYQTVREMYKICLRET